MHRRHRIVAALAAGLLAPIVHPASLLAQAQGQRRVIEPVAEAMWGELVARDDRAFWTIQEYAEIPIGATSRWGTHWARVGTLACPEDHDGDNAVGPGDLLAVLAGFGAGFGPDDLLALLASFGADCP